MHQPFSAASSTRREFLKRTGQAAAVSALAALAAPAVHAAEDNVQRVALVGCGGRGGGAIQNALAVEGGGLKLVAMADVFNDRLAECYGALQKKLENHFAQQVEVPEERKFIGFDAYQKAMDCLRPGDIVILTTPPAFRWVHYTYAIAKGLNVFMEKPLAVDGPTARRMLVLNEEAQQKNLKVAVGLMCRHCEARQQLFDRIQNGEIGDLVMLRAYRMEGPIGSCFSPPKSEDLSELLWQIKRFHSFLWASGGAFSDFFIHNIDECCWMKNAWPIEAKASGGRQYRGDNVDQNFDSYSVEYSFADGAKLLLEGRNIPGCYNEFASYAHGTRGSAVISTSSHTPARCRTFKSQRVKNKDDLVWSFPQNERNPYQLEWNDFVKAIQQNVRYNEVQRGVEASLVTAMGRMAAHTGQVVTFHDMLNCDHEFAPQVDKLDMHSAAPLVANAEGKYAIPTPGLSHREYA